MDHLIVNSQSFHIVSHTHRIRSNTGQLGILLQSAIVRVIPLNQVMLGSIEIGVAPRRYAFGL